MLERAWQALLVLKQAWRALLVQQWMGLWRLGVQQKGWEQGEVQLPLQQQQMQQPALWLGWVLLLLGALPWS